MLEREHEGDEVSEASVLRAGWAMTQVFGKIRGEVRRQYTGSMGSERAVQDICCRSASQCKRICSA